MSYSTGPVERVATLPGQHFARRAKTRTASTPPAPIPRTPLLDASAARCAPGLRLVIRPLPEAMSDAWCKVAGARLSRSPE